MTLLIIFPESLLYLSLKMPHMKMPFTTDEFLTVFERYNEAIWPAQLVLYALAVLALLSLHNGGNRMRQVVFSVLSLLWAWMGGVYHITYFSTINKAAYAFGLIFLVQSFIFIYEGIIQDKISLRLRFDTHGIIGIALIAYALIVYPLIGLALGHVYPKSPTFGVPCPTTIFTFGILLFSSNRISFFILLIPFAWSIVGLSAALNLAIYEDIGLVISGIVSTAILTILKKRRVMDTVSLT